MAGRKCFPATRSSLSSSFQNTTGKNSTDSALIIDAMDLLHQGIIECFCLVSSDSDFTRLATRIRESGCFVIGIGREKHTQDVCRRLRRLGEDGTPEQRLSRRQAGENP
jgi:uncharacterized LabA/DUF88 family protein